MPLIRAVIGEDLDRTFTLTEEDGVTPADLTTATATFILKEDAFDADGDAVLTIDSNASSPAARIQIVTPATGGQAKLIIPAASLPTVIPGRRYPWHVKVIDADGDPTSTWIPLRGDLIAEAA